MEADGRLPGAFLLGMRKERERRWPYALEKHGEHKHKRFRRQGIARRYKECILTEMIAFKDYSGTVEIGKNISYEMYLKNKQPAMPSVNMETDNLPLVEAAKIEMSLMPTKTPVSILQELLSRRGTTPKYELVQIEGAIHEPTFRYRVTVADAVALGTGRSKKVAKHAAAKNILEKLVGEVVRDEATPSTNATNIPNQAVNSYDKISGNPIGTLQEMCISHRWQPPTYEMTSEEGLPHERQFTIACVVFQYREIGTGKSKKLAKRQAAYKMWEKLQECPPDVIQIGGEMGQGFNSPLGRYSDLKNSKIATLTTPHSLKVSTFHKNLKQSTGVKLDELQQARMQVETFNPIEFLQEIATEQRFAVTYVDIEETSQSGKYQCLVQISTLPVAVCHGTGDTVSEAQSASALNALEYLKIMTKK
ncbi:hypothetical protein RUM44_006726 [Polyplax serrata]|uniref:DRBM domain-containing protein n=1 Tax=Polyplax serrata TaxID=468196 RepID=A0ABR1AIY1_POLSC